jgi:hypothetical protein
MHGDIRSENMAAYSWERGYDPNFRRQYNIQENLVLGEEERIRELGKQIYGQVDESGYYTNRADFSQLDDGNTTVVARKVEKPEEKKIPEPTAIPENDKVAVAKLPNNPTPQFALGGNMYGLNEDMTLVETETGKPIAQMGQNEKIEKQGNAIQVTPETKLKADELAEKYDASSEVETRMNDIEDRIDQQQETTNQETRRPVAPERVDTKAPDMWRESVAAAERTVSPSFNRAIARSKFFPEGHHYQRGAVSSKST